LGDGARRIMYLRPAWLYSNTQYQVSKNKKEDLNSENKPHILGKLKNKGKVVPKPAEGRK
jgi:hypothetical protein